MNAVGLANCKNRKSLHCLTENSARCARITPCTAKQKAGRRGHASKSAQSAGLQKRKNKGMPGRGKKAQWCDSTQRGQLGLLSPSAAIPFHLQQERLVAQQLDHKWPVQPGQQRRLI